MWLHVMTHFKQDRWMVLGFVQAKAKEWAPLIMKGRDPSEPICMTKACHLDCVTVIRDDGAISNIHSSQLEEVVWQFAWVPGKRDGEKRRCRLTVGCSCTGASWNGRGLWCFDEGSF